MKANALIRAVAAVVLVGVASPIQAEEPKDVADLFPPDTLAYAELTNPGELAPQLADVFKGTVLEDSIPFIHKRKDAATTLMELNGKREIAGLGLLTSPEMIGEFKKLRGVAVGLTGFTTGGEAEAALVVMTGDSPAAGLAARAFLTMTPTLRRVGEVSKVPVFQYRNPNINYDMNGIPMVANDKPPMESPYEMMFAYTPGLFVVGTGKSAVSHSIKRFLGEDKSGLGGTAMFKQAAAVHRQTGLFYFVNFGELAKKFDAANKVQGGMAEPDAYAWLKILANSRSIQSVAGNIRFRDGGLSATLAATFDLSRKSPLMEFLSGPEARIELLHHAQRPALLAIGVSLPAKNRSAATLNLLDAMAKSSGELGRLPSDVVKELEEKYKVSVAEGLLGKTRAITIVLPAKQELPKDAKPLPILVLHSEDATTAAAWLDCFPKLIADLSRAGKPPQPSSETIEGIKVYSLPGNGLPWNGAVHYAQNGATVAIGLDRKLVAAAVVPKAATSIAGTIPNLPSRDKPANLLGTVSILDVIPLLFEKTRPSGPVVPVEEVPNFLPNGLPGVGNQLPENLMEDIAKARKEFFASLSTLAATLTVQRNGSELRIEVFQTKVQKGALKPVIDSAANWLDRWGSTMGSMREFDYGR